jgi:hypothetical protein
MTPQATLTHGAGLPAVPTGICGRKALTALRSAFHSFNRAHCPPPFGSLNRAQRLAYYGCETWQELKARGAK